MVLDDGLPTATVAQVQLEVESAVQASSFSVESSPGVFSAVTSVFATYPTKMPTYIPTYLPTYDRTKTGSSSTVKHLETGIWVAGTTGVCIVVFCWIWCMCRSRKRDYEVVE